MQESGKSPLARLVLFIICLSIAGSLLAGSHYILIDRPAQEYAAHPPANYSGTCDAKMSLTGYVFLRLFGYYPGTSADCTPPYSIFSCCIY
jgi:hypothetical protein